MEKPPVHLHLKQALNQPVGKLAIFLTGAAVGLAGWMACIWEHDHWVIWHWWEPIILMGIGSVLLLLGSKLNDRYERRLENLRRSRPPA